MGKDHEPFNFEEIIDQYGESLIRLAYFYLKDWSTAEDIVQDAFIRFYEKQHQFNYKSTLHTYLYRITINLCHDYQRKWSNRMIVFTEKFKHPFTKRESIEREIITKDKNTQIAEVVLNLPVIYREVIILFYYYDLKIHEISELLKTPENTIKSRLHRARNLLKESSLKSEWEVDHYESN